MYTAEDLMNICKDAKTGYGPPVLIKKLFKVAANVLRGDEAVTTVFTGTMTTGSNINQLGVNVYVLTDKRFIVVSKVGFREETTTFNLDQIDGVDVRKSLTFSEVTVKTLTSMFVIKITTKAADAVRRAFDEVLSSHKQVEVVPTSGGTSMDQFMQFVTLHEKGIITDDELKLKKKELLGL